MELSRHTGDHVIEVRVEISSLRNVDTERRVVVVAGHQVVSVVDDTGAMGLSLGQIWGPETAISLLGLMHGEVWGPHSVMDDALPEVPFLEEIALVFLMGWVQPSGEHHLVYELSLPETLIDKIIVFSVDSTMTALAHSLPNLETTSQSTYLLCLGLTYVAEL